MTPGRNAEANFHGQKSSNETPRFDDGPAGHFSQWRGYGSQALLHRHALMKNRNGLVVDARLTEVNGHAERIAALHMIEPRADRPMPITLGADKAYDTQKFGQVAGDLSGAPSTTARSRSNFPTTMAMTQVLKAKRETSSTGCY